MNHLHRVDPELREALQASRRAGTGVHSDGEVDIWIAQQRARGSLSVRLKPLAELDGWKIDPETGNIKHVSGRFFTLTGLHVRHRYHDQELEWDQPIIDQAEIGILGILVKEIAGVLHFCLQAKEEPGNLHGVQLSPTVQATYSNYTQSHGGSRPPFIDHFLEPDPDKILYAKLQSEDGGRFLYKLNRNMIIQVGRQELNELPPEFIWLTLAQIGRLLRQENLLHATTRSILCGLLLTHDSMTPFGNRSFQQRLLATLQWYDDKAAVNHFQLKRIGLNTLNEWNMTKRGFFAHKQNRFFQIIGLHVSVASREVAGGWDQPILNNPELGIIGLVIRLQKKERYFLMQAKAEPGNRTVLQLGPTVQFTPGNYIDNNKLAKPFLFDEFLRPRNLVLLADSMQAEEGARFYRESHRHRILELPAGMPLDFPSQFRWVSETELRFFLTLGGYINSCARSILACVGQIGTDGHP